MQRNGENFIKFRDGVQRAIGQVGLEWPLCNALLQFDFDCACSVWYPNLNQKWKKKLKTTENKGICFCLNLDKIPCISPKLFEALNGLAVRYRFNQCVNSLSVGLALFVNSVCPDYQNEIFEIAPDTSIILRNNFRKLKKPFCNTTTGQNSLKHWSLVLK